jgi:hypothetical protein
MPAPKDYIFKYITGTNESYTGCIKKTEQIRNCSQFRKTAISIQFLMYIASLGTYNEQ